MVVVSYVPFLIDPYRVNQRNKKFTCSTLDVIQCYKLLQLQLYSIQCFIIVFFVIVMFVSVYCIICYSSYVRVYKANQSTSKHIKAHSIQRQ